MLLTTMGLWASGVCQVRLTGFLEYDHITYFENVNPLKINGRNQVILNPIISYSPNDNVRLFSAVEIRYDQADPARNRVFLDEAYVDLFFGDFDIRIGRQIFNWGQADGFNPTDNLTAWDFSDFLDLEDEKLGQVAVSTKYYLGNWSLEGVFVPGFTPSKLPSTNSRWWIDFGDEITNPYYPAAGPPVLPVTYNRLPDLLPSGPESFQYAFKLSGYSGGWDYSISWFDGYDDLPSIHTSFMVDSTFSEAVIDYQFQYHSRDAIGADLATTINKIAIRGEVAYFLTEDMDGTDPEIDDPYLQYVIGMDYTFTDLFGKDDLWVLVEWIQELQVPGLNTEYRIIDLNHVFRKSLLGTVQYKFSDYFDINVGYTYNLYADDWLLQPSLNWSVMDGMKLSLISDLIGGPADTFFGSYSRNDRIQVRLKYSF